MSVKKDSYICIEAFMVNELKLSGTELIVYAIIYGFSQDGKSFFSGSHSYLAEWCGCSERSIWNQINSLIAKGLLEKKTRKEGSLTFCYYRAIRPETPTENISDGKSLPRKSFHSATENISAVTPPATENISDNILDNIYTSNTLSFGTTAPKAKKPPLIDREPVNDLERIEKAYLENYRELFKKGIVHTEKPVINWAQSRRLVNNSIARFGYDTIMDAVQKSINNAFCVQKGYTLTTILSSGVLAGLINGNSWKQSVRAIDKVDHPDDMGEILF
jgi:hypothetical protein